jgi:hypothetical protein
MLLGVEQAVEVDAGRPLVLGLEDSLGGLQAALVQVAIMTSAPSSRNLLAMALPMPLPEPVTTADFPSRRIIPSFVSFAARNTQAG